MKIVKSALVVFSIVSGLALIGCTASGSAGYSYSSYSSSTSGGYSGMWGSGFGGNQTVSPRPYRSTVCIRDTNGYTRCQ